MKNSKKIPSAKKDLVYNIIGLISIGFSIAAILGLYQTRNRQGVIIGGLTFGLVFIGVSFQNSRTRKRRKNKKTSLDVDELIEKYKS
mgnify:CR=1 FL=1